MGSGAAASFRAARQVFFIVAFRVASATEATRPDPAVTSPSSKIAQSQAQRRAPLSGEGSTVCPGRRGDGSGRPALGRARDGLLPEVRVVRRAPGLLPVPGVRSAVSLRADRWRGVGRAGGVAGGAVGPHGHDE